MSEKKNPDWKVLIKVSSGDCCSSMFNVLCLYYELLFLCGILMTCILWILFFYMNTRSSRINMRHLVSCRIYCAEQRGIYISPSVQLPHVVWNLVSQLKSVLSSWWIYHCNDNSCLLFDRKVEMMLYRYGCSKVYNGWYIGGLCNQCWG